MDFPERICMSQTDVLELVLAHPGKRRPSLGPFLPQRNLADDALQKTGLRLAAAE